MNKKSLYFLPIVLILTVLICGSCKIGQMAEGDDPAELWNKMTKTDAYTKWSFWPDHKGMQPGNAPHGPFHKVYVNDKALKAGKTPLPDGAMMVKENYSKKNKLLAITIMKKIKGFNPDGGDWFWVKYSPEGNADRSGRVAGCIKCHSAHSDNDYVFVHVIN